MTTSRLIPHPASSTDHIRKLEVSVKRHADSLSLYYLLSADIRQLRIPAPGSSKRENGLWKHTCFELFVLDDAAPAYQEFNFSPSGAWAHYRFSDYRTPLADDASHPAPDIQVTRDHDSLRLEVSIPIKHGKHIGLSAVIENNNGTLSYWALHHPTEQPNFHHPDAFTLKLA